MGIQSISQLQIVTMAKYNEACADYAMCSGGVRNYNIDNLLNLNFTVFNM